MNVAETLYLLYRNIQRTIMRPAPCTQLFIKVKKKKKSGNGNKGKQCLDNISLKSQD